MIESRWSYYRVFEEGRRLSRGQFIGRCVGEMVKEGDHYALYEDQDGRLHLAFRSQVFVQGGYEDFVEIRCYLYCWGRTRAELGDLCRMWEVEPPSILEYPPYG